MGAALGYCASIQFSCLWSFEGYTRTWQKIFQIPFHFYVPKKKTIQTLSQDVIINSFLLPESKGFFCSIITICLEGRNCSWLMTSLITTCRRFQLSTEAKKCKFKLLQFYFICGCDKSAQMDHPLLEKS